MDRSQRKRAACQPSHQFRRKDGVQDPKTLPGFPAHTVVPALQCLVGNAMLMLPALTIGASGCVDGPPNVAPELWVEIWNAYNDCDIHRAEAAQEKASQVTELVRSIGLHAGTKAILSERLGIDCGSPRAPGQPITPEQRTMMKQRLNELGIGRAAVAQSGD